MVLVRIGLGILAALLGSACSTTIAASRSRPSQTLGELNAAIEGKDAEVTLDTNVSAVKTLQVKDVKVGSETSQWLELRPRGHEPASRTIPTAALRRIEVRSQVRGMLDGLGIGLLAGLPLGVLAGSMGATIEKAIDSRNDTRGIFFQGVVLGVVLGEVVGGMVGLAVGHSTTVEFE
jgi:hypothetical protein